MSASQSASHDIQELTLEEIVAAREQQTTRETSGHHDVGTNTCFENRLGITDESSGTTNPQFFNTANIPSISTPEAHHLFETELLVDPQQMASLEPRPCVPQDHIDDDFAGNGGYLGGPQTVPFNQFNIATLDQAHTGPVQHDQVMSFTDITSDPISPNPSHLISPVEPRMYRNKFPLIDAPPRQISYTEDVAMDDDDNALSKFPDSVGPVYEGSSLHPLGQNVGINDLSIDFTQIARQTPNLHSNFIGPMNSFQPLTSDTMIPSSIVNVQADVRNIHSAQYSLNVPKSDYFGKSTNISQLAARNMAADPFGMPTDSVFQMIPGPATSESTPSTDFLNMASENYGSAINIQNSMAALKSLSVTSKMDVSTAEQHRPTHMSDGCPSHVARNLVGPVQKRPIFEIDQYTNPEEENRREKRKRLLLKSRKRTRHVGERTERACIICKPNHRKCSTPCPKYQTFVRDHAHLLSHPMFTRDVRINFSEICSCLFRSQACLENTEKEVGVIISTKKEAATLELLKPFIPILDALDPNFNRKEAMRQLSTSLSNFVYLQDIVRWKRELSLMFPQRSEDLETLERCHQDEMRARVWNLGKTFRSGVKGSTTVQILIVYDEICSLGLLNGVDHHAAEHLTQALQLYFVQFRGDCLAQLSASFPSLHPSQEKIDKVMKENRTTSKYRTRQEKEDEKYVMLFAGIDPCFKLLLTYSRLRQFLPKECEDIGWMYILDNNFASYTECLTDTEFNAYVSDLYTSDPFLLGRAAHLIRRPRCLCALATHCLPAGNLFSTDDVRDRVHQILDDDLDIVIRFGMLFGGVFETPGKTSYPHIASGVCATIYRHIFSKIFQHYLELILGTLASLADLEGFSPHVFLWELWPATCFDVITFTLFLLDPCLEVVLDSGTGIFEVGEMVETTYNQSHWKKLFEDTVAVSVDQALSEARTGRRPLSGNASQIARLIRLWYGP